MATDMGKIEAQTAHTVKLTWGRKELLEKSDLIRGLSDTLPDGALITGLSVADIPVEEPHEITQVAKRVLAITYVDNPAFARYRRP